jgi:hypothetical protein
VTIKSCTIGEISHITEDDLFVGEVVVQFSSDGRAAPMRQMSGHEMLLVVRMKGDKTWPFDRIQSKFLKQAQALISEAADHLDGATIDSLNDHNLASAKEDGASMVFSLLSAKP